MAPLLLTLVHDEKTKVLEEERTLILAEPDVQKRRDLLALAVTIATRHFDSRYLWRFFTEQEVKQMRDATFIDELLADKVEKRVNEKLDMARAQIARQMGYDNILDVLIARFNPPAARYRPIERQLEAVQDVETLRELLVTLVQVEDLAEFEQALAQAGR